MAKKSVAKKDKTMDIVGLIVNLFIPGLGSLIAGWKNGVPQLILAVVGFVLQWIPVIGIIGWIAWIIAWIWALIDGIKTLAK
jgi:hypothetical protein